MRKEIEELTNKVSGSGVAGTVLRPVENEDNQEGGGLGNIGAGLV